MFKLTCIVICIWILFFLFRIVQIGGLSDEKVENVELLRPQREYLVSLVDQIMPSPESKLLSGILLGAQSSLPYSLKQDLQKTSTIHMIVVSGQNLTLLAGFLTSLVYILGRKKTLIISFIIVVLYSVLTGLQVPTIRALIMASLAYTAQVFGKEKVGWWTLFLTAGIMLLFNPNYLINISFQLSFLATFAVIVVAPEFKKRLSKLPNLLREDLSVTLSAQLLTLPIIAIYFHQISIIGVFANLLVGWTIPIIMIFGFITLIFGFVSIILAKVVAIIPMVFLTYYVDLIKLFANLPGAFIKVGDMSIIFWIGYYLLIGSLILSMLSLTHAKKSVKKRLKTGGF